jgi:hypothetical protein
LIINRLRISAAKPRESFAQAESDFAAMRGNARKEYAMGRVFTFALAIAVSVGTTAVLAINTRTPYHRADTQLNSEAAFRDGLYIGRLAAERGQTPRPPIGRWSTEKDRSLFVVGYGRGYNEFLAGMKPEDNADPNHRRIRN